MTQMPLARRLAALLILAALHFVWFLSGTQSASAQGVETLFLPMLAAPGAPGGGGDQTSAQLIDEALARKEINAETALVYKVFASFGDPRLPEKYRGSGDEFDAILLRQVVGQYASLSGDTQAVLAPFFQPPIYTDSWYAPYAAQSATPAVQGAEDQPCAFDPGPSPIQPGGWACADGVGANFRVWWQTGDPGSAAMAKKVYQAMQNDIWPKLAILMRRDPPSDKGPHRFVDLNGEEQVWWDGGDGRLDIYLSEPPPRTGGAATLAYPPGCDKRPSFMLISTTIAEDTLIPAVTHEFFHTFQFGMDQGKQCEEYEWWSEATANWAIDFVYPADNWEHEWAYYFIQTRDWQDPIRDQISGGRSSYLFPFFLTHYLNDPGIIRRSWENAAKFPKDSLAAIDQAIGGGLSDVWHEFALRVANQAPVDDFRTWDAIDIPIYGDKATGREPVIDVVGYMPRIGNIEELYALASLNGGPDVKFEMPTDIPHLAMRGYRFRFKDSQARSVGFMNPLWIFPQPDADVKIQALVKVAGKEWVREDWTTGFARTFCRQQHDENLEELIIVISNGQWRNRGEILTLTPAPSLSVTNIGCFRWEGTFETTITAAQPGTNYTDHYSGRLAFEPRTDLPENPIYQYYELAEASVTWEQHGTLGGCQIDGGPTTYSALKDFSGNLQTSSFSADKAMDYRIHTGVVSLQAKGIVTSVCDGKVITSDKFHGVIAAFGQGTKPITANGLTLQGRHSESVEGYTTVTTWTFTAKPQP